MNSPANWTHVGHRSRFGEIFTETGCPFDRLGLVGKSGEAAKWPGYAERSMFNAYIHTHTTTLA